MASGSGSGSWRGYGREGPRHSISMKGKGTMVENLGRDSTRYHEYLQHRSYAEDLGLNSHTLPFSVSEPDPNATPLPTPIWQASQKICLILIHLQSLNMIHRNQKNKKILYRSKANLISSSNIWRNSGKKMGPLQWLAITALKYISGTNLEDMALIGGIF